MQYLNIPKILIIPIIGFILLIANSAVYAQPKAGTTITNIASGDFYDAQGNLQVINSNPVVLSVQPI